MGFHRSKWYKTRVPSHWSVLHVSVSSRSGHKAPPFSGSWTTSLALVLVPPSQVTLHPPQVFHSPTLQSTRNQQLNDENQKARWYESTWASSSVAGHCFLQIWTHSSSVVRLLHNLPYSRLGSTIASRTAIAPWLPIANLAVNWKCEILGKYLQM